MSTSTQFTAGLPSAPAPVQPVEGLMAGRAFGYWLTNYRRVWRATIISGFLGPLFFLLAMGYGLGALVDDGASGGVAGVSYLTFIAPGILAAQAMQTAAAESSFTVMGAIKWQRQYHAMLAAPLGIADIMVGHLLFVLLRITLTTVSFAIVALAVGAVTSMWVVPACLVAVLTGFAFATPIFAFAALQQSDSSGGFNFLFRFLITPMFLFSGTFFPTDRLPAALEVVAWLTPLWHGVELCRDLVMNTATVADGLGHVAYLLLWVAVGLWLAFVSFRRRLVT